MKLIRLTFAGKGIFRALRALDDVDMEPWDEQDLYDAERDFDEYMKIPDVCTIMGKTKSYFTENGYDRFEILKSLPVTEEQRIRANDPGCDKRSTCILSTFISLCGAIQSSGCNNAA